MSELPCSKMGQLRIYDRNITIYVLSPWKYVTVELDGNGYFRWSHKTKPYLNGNVNINGIFEEITSGADCNDLPFVPALPINGKIENMIALPADPTDYSCMHFFLCCNIGNFSKWMKKIFEHAGNRHGQSSFIPRNPVIPSTSQLSQFPIASGSGGGGGGDIRYPSFPMPAQQQQQQWNYSHPVSSMQQQLQENLMFLHQTLQQTLQQLPYYRNGQQQYGRKHQARQPRFSPGSREHLCRNHIMVLGIGTANVELMANRDWDMMALLKKHELDLLCLQNMGWPGQGHQSFDGNKLYWIGGENELCPAVGVMVSRDWVKKVKGIRYINERIIMVKLQAKKYVLNIISVQVPGNEATVDQKEHFYRVLKDVVTSLFEYELLIICGQSGSVGWEERDDEPVNGVGNRSEDNDLIQKFANQMELAKKRSNANNKSDDRGGVIDYILTRRADKRWLQKATVIPDSSLGSNKLFTASLSVNMRLRNRESFLRESNKRPKLEEENDDDDDDI